MVADGYDLRHLPYFYQPDATVVFLGPMLESRGEVLNVRRQRPDRDGQCVADSRTGKDRLTTVSRGTGARDRPASGPAMGRQHVTS